MHHGHMHRGKVSSVTAKKFLTPKLKFFFTGVGKIVCDRSLNGLMRKPVQFLSTAFQEGSN